MSHDYLSGTHTLFLRYKTLAEKTFDQLSGEQLVWKSDEESNSIAVIVKHLWGNMRSRWTGFLTTDGEKPWRERDAEFRDDLKTREEILTKWDEGWEILFKTLGSLSPEDLQKKVTLRGEELSVTDAVNRQLAHTCYHIGQIIYIGKMLRGDDWQNLSIPRGGSKAYNERMYRKKR